MNVLRKLVVLAPVMLLSLTACEAKIDETKAGERVATYDAAKVTEEYKSYDEKSECNIKKNTGVFADGGLLSSIVKIMKEALNQEQKDVPAAEGIYTTNAFGDLMNAAAAEGAAKPVISYYAYKNTGLKIVGETKQDANSAGTKQKASAKVEMYVFDDGRIEKASGSMKMSVSGEAAGVKLTGDLDLSFKVTYTWHKA